MGRDSIERDAGAGVEVFLLASQRRIWIKMIERRETMLGLIMPSLFMVMTLWYLQFSSPKRIKKEVFVLDTICFMNHEMFTRINMNPIALFLLPAKKPEANSITAIHSSSSM
ncbi:uncharacterized protein DS421_12g367470 [Arachis hypogaea]|nr:uncharacterized protein DS421_12g367470 [Arachis hypogaea]